MEQISKDIVLAAVVKTFFKYFATGVIEERPAADAHIRYEPRNVKQAMLNCYEKIAPAFNREAFYAFFKMNYTEEEAEPVLRRNITATTTHMELVRLACRTEEFYSAMVSEYKRNFEQLLCGQIAVSGSTEAGYTHCPSAGFMPQDKAERIISGIAAAAYQCGKKAAKESCG